MDIELLKNRVFTPLLLAAGLTLLAAVPGAQAEQNEPGLECDDNDTRDRSSSGRRRTGGSNRDCTYREVVVDETTGEVTREAPQSETRTVLPRRYSSIPRPTAEQYVEAVPIPDRWRIVDSLGYEDNWWDPYNQNTIKGDKPIHGDWFFNVTAISDSVLEWRDVPTPVGGQTTRNPGSLDVFGDTEQFLFNQNVAVELVYYQGDTVFRPPDWEFRFTPVFNYNYTELDEVLGLNADPGEDDYTRSDGHAGIQAAFVDKHLRNVSDRYDFDSLRVGIQPFSSDFRGFLFQDSPFGVRLFGTRSNNRFQYNLAWFRRMEKDTNSGLNDVGEDLRDDDVFVANLYWQDQPSLGFFSQFTAIYNRNREDEIFYDDNDFIARPASVGQERLRDYDVYYLGYNGDGHIGRVNLTTSFYVALGEEEGAVFNGEDSDIEAYFFAAEPSMDFDWIRARLSFLYGSGDDDPFDDKSQGFDAIFENPQFAGADTSYWIRQGVPLIGGGRVALSQRNGVLNSMRSSKEHGQSNFTNPGVVLVGGGVDMDILPELRLSLNANYLAFAETEVLEVARNQGSVDSEIGMDLSAALIWRPFMSQNVVARLSYAQLLSGDGFQDLYGDDDPYSVLLNVILTF
ncbi:hypothetical protein [Pseudohalioglobus lutimaris]|uniref:Alginate export domain-containing protein n=1 Tax=Pseudohalioglobus lutimaris TaxID=1737061 RepID=A0A2N5X2B2_9GAMM|nr:hypothetical protein [Pseudohalioglobus lutimaris]PLW68632.1 hypothetical protein C0039_11500 [Pseudohalioglobus lutimaris]